jgi:hypothetical protein
MASINTVIGELDLGIDLPKVTIILDEGLNKRARKYIVNTYPDSQYGKLKAVMEDALKEYLEKKGF